MTKVQRAAEILRTNPEISNADLAKKVKYAPTAASTLRKKADQYNFDHHPIAAVLKAEVMPPPPKHDSNMIKPDMSMRSKGIEMTKNGDFIILKIPVNEISQLLLASLLKQQHMNNF